MKTVENKLRVLHFAQVPCEPFVVEVANEYEAAKIINILAKQHLFLYEQRIIPDYANILDVEMFEGGEWTAYWNEEEMMDWEEVEEIIESKLA